MTLIGLQGAAEALTGSLRPLGIAATVINPGNVATPEVESDISEGRFGDQVPIPLADILRTLDYVLSVSAESIPSSISLRQKRPGDGWRASVCVGFRVAEEGSAA